MFSAVRSVGRVSVRVRNPTMLANAYMAKITTAMKRMISHHDIWITTIPSGLRFLRSPQDRSKPAEANCVQAGTRIGGLALAAAPWVPGRGHAGRPGHDHE